MSVRSNAFRCTAVSGIYRILIDAGITMAKGNKPVKNDKANKKPKKAKKKSISGNSLVGNM